MTAVPKSLETLCDKEFDLKRGEAYEGVDREIAELTYRFAAMGSVRSSGRARAVVDAILQRYSVVLTAFEDSYFDKWATTEKPLSTEECEWLRGKAFSRLDPEIIEVRSRCQTSFAGDTLLFAEFWQQAEVKARERRSKLLEKLDILKLRKDETKEPTLAPRATALVPLDDDFSYVWGLLHPTVVSVGRSRFEAGNLADAVEACLKEFNDVVRKMVREKTGKEYDGSSLMNYAFSASNPVIRLDDLSTASGRDIQVGYMQMAAGAMTGVRNPKAHANIEISGPRAIHFLFLASLLFSKLDERID